MFNHSAHGGTAFPSAALPASGSLGIISARYIKAPLILLDFEKMYKGNSEIFDFAKAGSKNASFLNGHTRKVIANGIN
jgi:hypothetical protein